VAEGFAEACYSLVQVTQAGGELVLLGEGLVGAALDGVQVGQELIGHAHDAAVGVIGTALDLPAVEPLLLPVPLQVVGERPELAAHALLGRPQLVGHFPDRLF